MRGLIVALWLIGGCSLLQTDETIEYTVVRGDTLTRIAKSHGVSVEDLQAWNALSDDRIEVGQRLIIRGASATEPVRTVTAKRKPKSSAGSGSSLSMPKAKACLKGPHWTISMTTRPTFKHPPD